MTITVVTPPAAEPITAELLAQQLRIDDAFAGQELIVAGIIQACRERAEAVTWRALMPQVLMLTLDDFPTCRGEIIIPRPPLVSIDSIVYSDSSGVMQTLAPSAYQVDTKSEPARVFSPAGAGWPTTLQGGIGNVVITFHAGYASADAVPACIKTWMLMNVASLYEHRETTVVGLRAQMVDLDTIVDALLEPVKVRWF